MVSYMGQFTKESKRYFCLCFSMFFLSLLPLLAQDLQGDSDDVALRQGSSIVSDPNLIGYRSQESVNANQFRLESAVDWVERLLNIELSVPIEKLELQTRYHVNGVIESNFSVWLYNAVQNLQVDSKRTLKDFWGSDILKNPYTFLKGILKNEFSVFYPNLRAFRTIYKINIYPDLIQIWVNDHFQHEELLSAIINEAATEFSGLIIYVRDNLPIRGEPYHMAKLKPALFPRLYSEDLNLILSYHNVEKQALLQHGMFNYDIEPNAKKYKDLIGNFPLRIVAHELFGSARTDLIISNSDAMKLLENLHIREIMQQGRILVLYESVPDTLLFHQN